MDTRHFGIDPLAHEKNAEWSKPDGQTHRGLDKIIGEYYALMQQPYHGQFLQFCDDNELDESHLWSQLFELDVADCAYLRFDCNFPLSYKTYVKPSKRRYPETIAGIDSCLRDHYLSLDAMNQYHEDADADGQSIFARFCDENGFDDFEVRQLS